MRTCAILALGVIGITFSGCGGGSEDLPDIGNVSGNVTLDGQPLADATVTFFPESGRPAAGMTDSDGDYTLEYKPGTEGAKIGKNSVTISTYVEAYEDENDKMHDAVPERVPTKYNEIAEDTPEMSVEVQAGSNTFDFKLSTEGAEVVQPAAEDDDC